MAQPASGTVEAQRARDSIIVNPVANGEVSGSETAGVPVDNGDDAPALDGLVSGNPGLKYYPSTDPYNQQGVVWVKGALELEGQLAIAVAKLDKIPKPFIDETLERNSRLFETLEGHRLPAVIDGLLRRYGYGDVANRLETGALAEISGPDSTPLSD